MFNLSIPGYWNMVVPTPRKRQTFVFSGDYKLNKTKLWILHFTYWTFKSRNRHMTPLKPWHQSILIRFDLFYYHSCVPPDCLVDEINPAVAQYCTNDCNSSHVISWSPLFIQVLVTVVNQASNHICTLNLSNTVIMCRHLCLCDEVNSVWVS